jgi:hypothetical protein
LLISYGAGDQNQGLVLQVRGPCFECWGQGCVFASFCLFFKATGGERNLDEGNWRFAVLIIWSHKNQTSGFPFPVITTCGYGRLTVCVPKSVWPTTGFLRHWCLSWEWPFGWGNLQFIKKSILHFIGFRSWFCMCNKRQGRETCSLLLRCSVCFTLTPDQRTTSNPQGSAVLSHWLPQEIWPCGQTMQEAVALLPPLLEGRGFYSGSSRRSHNESRSLVEAG